MYAVTTKGKTVWIERTLNGGPRGTILVDTEGKTYERVNSGLQIVEIEVSEEVAEALETTSVADLGDNGVEALAEGVAEKVEGEVHPDLNEEGVLTAGDGLPATEAVRTDLELVEAFPKEVTKTPGDEGAAEGGVESTEEPPAAA